jgi:hypothetical protein
VASLIDNAPLTNAEGFASAANQFVEMEFTPSWATAYDRREDVLFLRREGAGPAIAYFNEDIDDCLLYLDMESGELTGVDVMGVQKRLAKLYPQVDEAVKVWRQVKRLEATPGVGHVIKRFLLPRAERDMGETVRQSLRLKGA